MYVATTFDERRPCGHCLGAKCADQILVDATSTCAVLPLFARSAYSGCGSFLDESLDSVVRHSSALSDKARDLRPRLTGTPVSATCLEARFLASFVLSRVG